MAFEPPRDRDSVEAFYTTRRLTELRLRPVEGRFDLAHLQEINRRIFQDLPGQGYDDVTPGEFRKPAPEGRDWVKHRSLLDGKVTSRVAYSPMDAADRAHLDAVLGAVDPAALSRLSGDGFRRSLASLYAQLDYIHPFSDGNSRTLREFTRSLADAAGYELRWETFAKSAGARDALFVARDLSVNAIAIDHVRNDDTRRDIAFSLAQLGSNHNLTGLLASAGPSFARPKRAVAFERLDAADAIPRFPELMPLYEQLARADSEAYRTFADNTDARTRFLVSVRGRIQAALDAGEVRVQPAPTPAVDRAKANEPDR